MEAQFADIKATLGLLCTKMDTIERSLHDLRVENSAVREELAAARLEITKRDETISKLTEQVNRVDQSSRANYIRIFGLKVTSDTPHATISKLVLDEVIVPVLNQAREAGDLPPSAGPSPFLIDQAFAIPTKKGGPCPVVVKLSNLSSRNLIFKYKKTALPQIRDLTSGKVRSQYTIVEDLTPANHAQLRALSADHRVRSVWSYNGQIRFKAHDSETIFKVRSLSDTFDSLAVQGAAHSAMQH
jgi:hypothetical protein